MKMNCGRALEALDFVLLTGQRKALSVSFELVKRLIEMDKWGQTINKAYSSAADLYNQLYLDCPDWQLVERQHFAELVKETGLSMLDVGCGPGRDLAIFSGLGLHPVGTDFSKDMLELAKESSCPLVEADVRKPLPFVDSRFSGVWACSVIPNIPYNEFDGWLVEAYRVLMPGGILFISARNGREGKVVIPYLNDMVTFRACYSLQDIVGGVSCLLDILEADIIKEYPTVIARKRLK